MLAKEQNKIGLYHTLHTGIILNRLRLNSYEIQEFLLF